MLPIHYAVESGNLKIIQILINNNSLIDILDINLSSFFN